MDDGLHLEVRQLPQKISDEGDTPQQETACSPPYQEVSLESLGKEPIHTLSEFLFDQRHHTALKSNFLFFGSIPSPQEPLR